MKDILMIVFPMVLSGLFTTIAILISTKSKDFEKKIEASQKEINICREDISRLTKEMAVMDNSQDTLITKLNSMEVSLSKKIDDLYKEVINLMKK